LRVCVVTILEVCNYDTRKESESARIVAMRESREQVLSSLSSDEQHYSFDHLR
jgi:hypothetical protein